MKSEDVFSFFNVGIEAESMKRRIDQLLVERGLADSRHKAQALLLAGRILVGEQKMEKCGQRVDTDAEIRVLDRSSFASRAGAKLQAALDYFRIPIAGRACADLGASTGGFTDCLLQNGASTVYAFDVGKGQLDWKLRSDPRVVVRDEFNVRNLKHSDLPDNISFISIDLSFISVTKVLHALKEAFFNRLEDTAREERPASEADVIVLVKPQFEAGRGEVGKGGIVRDPAQRMRILAKIEQFAREAKFHPVGSIPSPVKGAGGNQEFLLYLKLTKDREASHESQSA
jgi:23S rRNA (cytidine1920-2'-O)/16S rRNA (cytidine1409-2'-O)-methyltransferase